MLRDGRTTEELGESLVVHLRTRLDAPALALEDPLRTITGGYANPIYRARFRDAPPPFDRELVIRADGRGSGPERLGREFEIQRFVHDHGYPTAEPIHFEPDGQVLGSPFVMMAWLDGTTLMDRIFPPGRRSLDAIDAIPDLMLQLHRIPTTGFPGDLDRASTYRARIAARAAESYPQLGAVSAWLEAERPPTADLVVCHLDFQPFNVMVDDACSVVGVLDWENTGLADRHLDVADCRIVLELAPFAVGRLADPLVSAARRWWTRRTRARYSKRWPLDAGRLRYYEVLAAARRLAGALEDQPDEPGGEPKGFTSPEYIAALTRFIARAIA